MLADILVALLVVAVVGLIAAVVLVLSSHFFAVKVDDRVTEIRSCLPGANCGACGFAGCDAYAKALVEGGVKTNLCIPGAQAVVEQISGILGVEVVEGELKEKSVAVVHCNGTCDAAPKKAIYDGINSCLAATVLYGGANACNYGCIGCGDCKDACFANAICITDGVARVDARLCIGCGMCAKVCPKGVIRLIPADSKQIVLCNNTEKGAVARKNCKNACIACKKCELNCPEKAITVLNNLAKIDYDKCSACGTCVENCPVHCITNVNFEV
ncbi:MAG: RnfABCDGE type electron transport complex subunit B [Ruminococcaceae bacterium]|nr:RnfABCDGE type electron transport complex subunit B [Oscillospiraceae bacterium]